MTTHSRTPNDLYQMSELLSAFEQADSVLLFIHIAPDGDTLGSTLALRHLLMRMGKRVSVVLDGAAPGNLSFLPGTEEILSPCEVVLEPHTLAVAVDVSCSDRMGAGEALFMRAQTTAQIDHHGTNPGYAMINLIDCGAPATALLISRVQRELDLPFTQEEAVCLYTAVSTDTGNFVYESTNAETFTLMADLMNAGLNLAHYSHQLFRAKERAFVALLGKTLPSLTLQCGGIVAGLQVSYADMCEVGATSEHTDGVVDYAIDIHGVKMAYFARETEDGTTKFSLRAVSPYRVDGVASAMGGGGHQLAAGCTVRAPFVQAVAMVRQALCEEYERSAQP